MKKLLLLTLAIVTLTSLVYSQSSPTTKNGWEEGFLKGKVKSYTESKYGAEDRFGEIQKKESSFSRTRTGKYDDKGNKIEQTTCYADGKLADKETYKYDDKGNLIERNFYNADGSLSGYKHTYRYNDKGNIIESKLGDVVIETFKYDDKGNKIEKISYKADGKLASKVTYEYDDKGNIIEKNRRDNTNRRENTCKYRDEKQTYKYDDKGNKIEENTYNADGSLFFVPVFQEIVKNHESLSSKIIIKYDDKGNRIEENIYRVTKGDSINGQVVGGGVSNYTITYKYDDKGNKIEDIRYNAHGIEKETYKYEFDEKGNWTKKISFKNQIPQNIEERKYEYYE
jgi:YD repeat-containing protein